MVLNFYSNALDFNRVYKVIFLTFTILLLSACGGGGGGGGSTDGVSGGVVSQNPNEEINEPWRIGGDNADSVVRHAIDSPAVVLKLALQLQEALDALIVSGKNHLAFDCYDSGNILLNLESNMDVTVDFNGCENFWLKESFDGQLKIYPEAIYSNSAHEVYFEGIVSITDALSLGGEAYSSLTGSFRIAQQATWHGDILLINHRPSNPVVLVDDLGDITIDDLAITAEFDLDEGRNMWPRSSLYSEFKIAIQSTELGGKYSCKSSEISGVGHWNPADYKIYCSDSIVQNYNLNKGNVRAHWRYFESIYKYEPGFPQPELEIPKLQSVEFDMPINDALYSAYTDRFYIAVPENAPEYSNHLVEFDATTGSVSRSLSLKGEAGELAISADGTILYLGYTGYTEVQRVELDTLSLTNILDLGLFLNNSLYAMEIAVSPQSNDIVAIATYTTYSDDVSYKHPSDIKFFRNGTEQPIIGGGTINPNRISFNHNGSRLLTYSDNSNIGVFAIESGSPEFIRTWNNYASGPSDLTAVGDILYNGNGSVMNIETGELLGRNTNVYGYNYEDYRKSASLISPNQKHTYVYAKYLEIFDKNRYTYQGVFDPDLNGEFLRLFNVGEDQFVFVTDTGIKLFKHSDIPDKNNWQCDFFSFPDLRVKINLEVINCLFNDAVFSPHHNKIYASIPGLSGSNGNSIAVINSESLVIEQFISVGSDPKELELSHNEQLLYVTYTGTNKYSVINLNTLTKVRSVHLGTGPWSSGPLLAGDLEPFPADESSVLISLTDNGYNADYAGMRVYTNGVKAPEELGGTGIDPTANRVRFADDNLVFGYNTDTTGFELSEFFVDTSGVTLIDEYDNRIWGFPNELEYSNGRLYSSLGYVVDTESREQAGKMEGLDTDNWTRHQFVVDESRGVLYLYASMLMSGNDPVVKVYSLDTFEELASVKMPAFSVLLGAPKALINLDEERLLVVLERFMYLLDKNDLQP